VNLQNLKMLEMAAGHLGSLLEEVVFLGGATVELWISDPAAPEFRPTVDVDVVVEIVTKPDYYRFQDRVLECGFIHDVESGVICRFEHPATKLILDVMPTETAILGFENRWQGDAFLHAEKFSLPDGSRIKVVEPPYLLATKLDAFRARGNRDFLGSRDFSDIVALIDGREELMDEVRAATEELRVYVAGELLELSSDQDFDRGLEGGLPSSPESRERVDLVLWPRIERLIADVDPLTTS
jgi:nucleotidyltransferase AbiEii toxin of type IV toxin-antitoxin system